MYYPSPHDLRREIHCNCGPWEVQFDCGVLQRPLPSKEAKSPPSPRSRVREGQGQQRKELDWDSQEMNSDSHAAHFALNPEAQAEVARRGHEDVELNATKQAAVEAKRIPDEI